MAHEVTQTPESEERAPQAAPEPREARMAALIGCLLYLAFYVGMKAFNAVPPKLPPLAWALFTPLTTIIYLLVLVQTLRLICGVQLTKRQEVMLVLTTLALFLGLNPNVHMIVRQLLAGKGWSAAIGSLTLVQSNMVLDVIVPFLLILTGAFFGQLIARLIRERAILVPVALVSGLIDFWGVYWGPVNFMSESAPEAVSGLGTATTAAAAVPDEISRQLPQHLAFFGNINPPDNIGIGDFVFLAFFLTCAYRLGFSAKRTMWGIFWGLLAACLLIALDGQTLFGHEIVIEYLPGLVFICGGVLLANLKSWHLSRQEWLMTGVVVAILGALISVSVVRAEMSKPKSSTTYYSLVDMSGHEAVTHVLRLLDEKAPKGEQHLLIAGGFTYTREATPRMKQWVIMVLGRNAHATVETSREYLLTGTPDPTQANRWQVVQQEAVPAMQVLNLLTQLDQRATGDALIATARSLPASALTLLDNAPAHAALIPSGMLYRLQLLPNHAVLLDDGRRRVKEISYER